MRDVWGSISTDEDGADLFPKDGQPAQAPWRFALVTGLPCVENLSDRQAADARRGRLAGKSLLGWDLTDPGCDASGLSECRTPLTEPHAGERLQENRLTRCGQQGWLKARGRQRTDSTHVLGKIRALTRVRYVWEAMRAALQSLATGEPDGLRAQRHVEWSDRDGPGSEASCVPFGEAAREAFAEAIGQHGRERLDAAVAPTAPQWLRPVPAVDICRPIGIPHAQRMDETVHWRASETLPPPSGSRGSPSDEEAHSSTKSSTTWGGDHVPLTETGEGLLPLLLPPGETTAAPVSADAMTARIPPELDRNALFPAEHMVESGNAPGGEPTGFPG